MKKRHITLASLLSLAIVVIAAIKGDVNGDGAVTAADVTALYNYLLNNDASGLVNGDVDGDGNITAGDVTQVYNILLNGQEPEPEPIVTEFTINGVTFKMVTVDGGTFRMGATDEEINIGDASAYDYPAHDVTLTTYSIGQTEVTGQLWDAVMGTNYYNNSTEPAYYLTLTNIEEFIAKLNEATGLKFRLPTEAEWEFAAQGGNLSKGYKYAGSNDIDEVAWYKSNSGNAPHPVAQKAPNELGLYDMSGNVQEWCSDRFYEYTEDPQFNPVSLSTSSLLECRGGSFRSTSPSCRVRGRNAQSPTSPTNYYGFRLALDNATLYNVGGVTFKMIDVEGGMFMMGAMDGDANALDDEFPVHQVTLSNFAIGQTEVTQELWTAVMGSNPSNFSGNFLPVENVSWNNCQEFVARLNEMVTLPDGYEFRLLTEAEWEFAARGGNNSQGYLYSGSNNMDEVAWTNDNSGRESHPVASKKPNELGLYDMSGNLQELCYDWYADQYPADPQVDPTGPETGEARITRGGCWAWYETSYNRVTFRDNALVNEKKSYIGLRLALAPKTSETFNINGVEFTMILVRGGTFTMGNDNNLNPSHEHPAHSVTLDDYYIAQTELTYGLWHAVMDESFSPSYYDSQAQNGLTWTECQQFITKLNTLTGKNFRLPTEAEWEFAARGGLHSKGYKYSGGDDLYSIAWFSGNVGNDFAPRVVAQMTPNELGLYDMSGNVAEWCQDWYSSTYYSVSPAYNPQGPTSGTKRVLRGGRLLHHAPYMRVDYRDSQDPDAVYEQSASLEGMRLAL